MKDFHQCIKPLLFIKTSLEYTLFLRMNTQSICFRALLSTLYLAVMTEFAFGFVVDPFRTRYTGNFKPSRRTNNRLYSTEEEDGGVLKSSKELQSEINKLVEDPPLLSSWNGDNFDENALPIPLFTATLVSFASIFFTGYLFYVGIYGFPDGP